MKLHLVDSNVVVVANQFNPSVFSQLWLTKHGLATEEEVGGEDCAFTNVFAQVITPRFALVVAPNLLQLMVRPGVEDQQKLVEEKIGKVVELLPHTPFSAVGLNFRYHAKPEKADVHSLTRGLFFVEHSPLHRAFDMPDAMFGGYLSKNVLGCRLRLDVKPVFAPLEEGSPPEDLLLLGFNFHHDLSQTTGGDAIRTAVAKWNEALSEAQRIADAVAEKDT